MKHANRLHLALATALLSILAHAATPDSSKQVMAYLEPEKPSYESLTAYYTQINQLPTDTFAVDIHGMIMGTAPAEALQFAKSKGIATFATVSNFDAIGFDSKITHAILNESKPRADTIGTNLRRPEFRFLERYSYSPREERCQTTVGQRLVVPILDLPGSRRIKPCGLVRR